MHSRNEFAEETREIHGVICSDCTHILNLGLQILPDRPAVRAREKVDSLSKEGSLFHP